MTDNDMTQAFGLTRGMARVVGVNLIEAVTEGWFRREELARLVDRCAACGRTERCQPWLAANHRAAVLPSYCSNKAELEALQM